MEIVVDAKVTAGPEGVAATEKEPDTREGGREGRKLTSRWIEKRLGQPLRRVSQTETTRSSASLFRIPRATFPTFLRIV